MLAEQRRGVQRVLTRVVKRAMVLAFEGWASTVAELGRQRDGVRRVLGRVPSLCWP